MDSLHISDNIQLLKRASGYWSKKEIYCNLTTDLIVVKNQYPPAFLLQEIKSFQEKITQTASFQSYFTPWIGKNYLGALKLSSLLLDQKTSWKNQQGALRSQKISKKKISNYFAEIWWEYYKDNTSQGISRDKLSRIPPLLASFAIDWETIRYESTQDFILNICKLSQISKRPDRKIYPNYSSLPASQKRQIFLRSLTAEERALIEWISPRNSISEAAIYYQNTLIAIDAATALSAWLRARGLLIFPIGLKNIDSYFSDFEVWPKKLLNSPDVQLVLKSGLLQLIAATTTKHVDDLPENLHHIYGAKYFRTGFYQSLSRWLTHPGIQRKRPVFPIDQLQLSANKEQAAKSWTPDWIKKQYNEAWYDFARLWWMHTAADQHKRNALRVFLSWACDDRHLDSPWEIIDQDLRNAHQPFYNGTYFSFLKKSSIQDKAAAWSTSATLFRVACHFGQQPNSPTLVHGNLNNPFKSFEKQNPFSKHRRKTNKTHRSGIPASIHEMMIDILLCLDTEGNPTFSWAENILSKAHLDIVKVPDPNKPNKEIEAWCPSRAACLAVLLLTPLRTAQARWLDQGLMDKEYYDFENKSMVPNHHELRNFRYPNGKRHNQQYGRASGILQFSSDLLTRERALSIYVNTNKTQLWNGLKKTGYEIPWPDGNDLLESDNPEQKAKGRWLARLYRVIEYQRNWMDLYDPTPHPISFFQSKEDEDRTTDLEEVQEALPWFVPLFRDLAKNKLVTYEINNERVGANSPVSYSKISYLFTRLAIETEEQWYKTHGQKIYLTVPAPKGGLPSCKFDLHSLRVTWISRLFEMGLPIHIISEYIVGHATQLMTCLYLKIQPSHAREALIQASQNSNDMGLEALLQKEQAPEAIQKHLVGNYQQDISEYLPDDFIAFVPVGGGICPMGGKGSMCAQGAITTPEINETKQRTALNNPVQGGCGNCRYFLTGPDFIMEQLFTNNWIMYQMRSLGREQKCLYSQREEIEWKLHESSALEIDKKQILERRRQAVSEKINQYNELLSPLIMEWCNRFEMLQLSSDLLQDQSKQDNRQLLLVGNHQLSIEDYSFETTETTDFGLVRGMIEQARIVTRHGYPLPEEPSRMLREFMSIILDQSQCKNLFYRIPDDMYATHAGSIMSGWLSDEFGDTKIQEYLDRREPLPMNRLQNKQLQLFMERVLDNYHKGKELAASSLLPPESHKVNK